MTLPLSGPISLGNVNVQLGEVFTQQISLNDTEVRALFERLSGQISMSDGYGKGGGSIVWTVGGNMITARFGLGGAGTQTAGLGFGGYGSGGYKTSTEEYNGTTWSAGGDMATAREGLAGAGTQLSLIHI